MNVDFNVPELIDRVILFYACLCLPVGLNTLACAFNFFLSIQGAKVQCSHFTYIFLRVSHFHIVSKLVILSH